MPQHSNPVMRVLLGLLLYLGALSPLCAQFSQVTATQTLLRPSGPDFLDLYTQNSSVHPMPEIMTIFDSSASMNSLMFHPLYQNNDLQDADDYRYMYFSLAGATGAAAKNTFTITATANNCPSATATYVVTASYSSTTGLTTYTTTAGTPNPGCLNQAPNITLEAYASANSSANAIITLVPQSSGNNPSYVISPTQTNGGQQGTTASIAPGIYAMTNGTMPYGSSSYAAPSIAITVGGVAYAGQALTPGTQITMTTYLYHPFYEGDVVSDNNIGWYTPNSGVATPAGTTTTITTNYLYMTVATWTVPTYTANPTTLTKITMLSSTGSSTNGLPTKAQTQTGWTGGTTVLTLNSFFAIDGNNPAGTGIIWTVSPTSNPGTCTVPTITGSPTNATLTSGDSVTWTLPSYCSQTGTANPVVTVTLNAATSAYMTANNLKAVGNLTGTTNANGPNDMTSCLRKPDGTAVQAADAAAAVATGLSPGYDYSAAGSKDVRNWIRAASHVRFAVTYTNPDSKKSVKRTIDIPIPWNVPQQTLTASYTAFSNPLADATVLDQEVQTSISNGQTITTIYGTNLQIPIDQTYKVENAALGVFSGNQSGSALSASATTTAYLYGVVYRPAYISWLFFGTYQKTSATAPNYTTDPTLPGNPTAKTPIYNYVVFDAANGALVQNQGTANCNVSPGMNWGAAFGPTGTWGGINVPTINDDGTQPGTNLLPQPDASSYRIPSLTRFQAVKNAAINTWINNQGNVYWAFRELDPTNEAGNGSAGSINQNSTTTWSTTGNPVASTTHVSGLDSAWTVLNNTAAQTTTTPSGNSVTVTSTTAGNSFQGMNRIAYLFAAGETPLTYAMARGMAQYSDPNSVFNAVEGTNVGQCLMSYLLLFTDGIDNNGQQGTNNTNASTPYLSPLGGTPTTFNAAAGNAAILGATGSIDRGGSYWNIYTYAGMGAHLADSTLGKGNYKAAPRTTAALGGLGNYPTDSETPDLFLPFAIPSRGSLSFQADHLITTMTVGVSLGGSYNNPASPKANLFYAAVAGNPSVTSGNFGLAQQDFHAFQPPAGTYSANTNGGYTLTNWVNNDWVPKTTDPGDYPVIGQAAPGAVYFFDGSNPTALYNAMKYAFSIAVSTSGTYATANPNLPFVGAMLGNEVYFGSFYPPLTGGPVWPGDLMMFGTQNVNGVLSYVDQSGNPITTLTPANAQWDAATLMANTPWTSRNLYTRYPGTISNPEPGISKWPSWTSSAFTAGTDPIFTYVDPPTSTTGLANQQLDLEFAAGGNTSQGAMPASNRSNIMGDIVNSVPAAVGYKLSQVSGSFTGNLAGVTSPTGFNLILVGTNQGWLHAFGEVTSSKTVTNSSNASVALTTGAIQELWAFMPTDFLNDLENLRIGSSHLHMVDGSPAIYFLDLPPSGSSAGNGVVDNTERAVAIVSLGKGGRSYYALDIHNPFTPTLLWSLVPDEWANFPQERTEEANGGPSQDIVQGILKNFGYSTCVPAFGRVQFNNVLHDCVFLGGGLSTPAVDAGFTATAPNGLGRSVIALDVYTGHVLGAVDLTASTIGGSTVGSVPAGVIPFEFILNSGMAERAYFMDYNGGLWSWGSKNVSTATGYSGFRIDTPEMTKVPKDLPSGWTPWQVRKVFQDNSTLGGSAYTNNRYTTLPAPWLVSNFTGPAYAPNNVPAAVGIAMISGDRNNPLDSYYNTTTNLIPYQHQLTVVFDRQDSRDWGLDTATGPDSGINIGNLVSLYEAGPLLTTPSGNDCSDNWFSVFTPGCSNYFLGTSTTKKYGYYAVLPNITTTTNHKFVPKGITTPLVDAGTLFYSFFTPTSSDPCTGGTGNTFTGTIGNVMAPVYDDARSNISLLSTGYIQGTNKAQWTGVASNFFTIGTTSVIQGGTVVTPSGGTALALQSYKTKPASFYPKVRVWRNVPTVP